MDKATKLASDITIYSKYSRYLEKEKRRESWDEIVNRCEDMHIKKFPNLKEEIKEAFNYVREKKILPSMRALQFGGKAIEMSNSRIYNCTAAAADYVNFFSEVMYLLLGGSGVGFSVEKRYIHKLPTIKQPKKARKYMIEDSIIGWADSIKVLMKAYFFERAMPQFCYDDIRPKGTPLKTAGGKAPGPAPLRTCHAKMIGLLESKPIGSQLTSSEVTDLVCFISDAVLSGGIRRAACLCLFDLDNEEMLSYKSGKWYETKPERARVNISAVAFRKDIPERQIKATAKDQFDNLWERVKLSGSGEPGIFWFNDIGLLNPCLPADAMLLTVDGYKLVSDLQYEDDIVFIDKNGEEVNGKVWFTGHKLIYRATLSNTDYIVSTDNHKFINIHDKEIMMKDLKEHQIKPFYIMNTQITEYTKYGFIQGDGSLGRLKSPFHKGLEVYFGEKDLDVAELFGFNDTGEKYIVGYNKVLKDLKFSSEALPQRNLPLFFGEWEIKEQSQFLKGLWSANGSVINNQRIAFKSTNKNLVNDLHKYLKKYWDINSYITTNKSKIVKFSNGNYRCKESYDLNISQYKSIIKFAEEIGFIHKYKTDSLEKLILKKAPKVTKVELHQKEKCEVFDFNLQNNNHIGVVKGMYNNLAYLTHNCAEISLMSKQCCNLTSINFSTIETQEEFNKRGYYASILGTIQATYTDFHYLNEDWKDNCEEDALLGISLTGIADGGHYKKFNLKEVVFHIKDANEKFAAKLGIKSSSRLTCLKPEGTVSLVVGASSGIHARHSHYYIRRMRFNKLEPIVEYLQKEMPELCEIDVTNHNQIIFSIPQKSPDRSIYRNESELDLLERVKYFHENWVKPGHKKGENTHNVSATVSVKDWDKVGKWMWDNREHYNGISVLPYDGGIYQQAPFEEITKEKYEEIIQFVKDIDIFKINENEDNTAARHSIACAGGACELNL